MYRLAFATSNHQQRLLSAVVLLSIIAMVVYYFPGYLEALIYVVAYQGLDEWCGLAIAMGTYPESKKN